MTSLCQLYSALATVLERSVAVSSGSPRDGEPRERTQARRATGFVDIEPLSSASSISVKESEADRSNDERAVTALVNVFLQDILVFGEVGDVGDGCKVEWSGRQWQGGWMKVVGKGGGLRPMMTVGWC